MDVYKYLDNEFDTIFTESLYEDYYTFGSEILDEGSNIKYFKYVTGHIGNVKKGYRWLKKYLPELFDNQNRFRIAVTMALHDRSKFLLNKEFKSYKDYFYGDEEKLNKVIDYYSDKDYIRGFINEEILDYAIELFDDEEEI